jgi:hypothetical protein
VVTPKLALAGTAPAVTSWSGALLAACSSVAGTSLRYAVEPSQLDQAQGVWGYGCRFVGSDGPWGGPLTVRLATRRRDLEREAAAMRLSAAGGGGAADVLAVVELQVPPEEATVPGEAGLFALVSTALGGVPLPELIGFNLHHSDDLLKGFAAHHDTIHRLPLSELPADCAIPRLEAAAEVDRIDRRRYPIERRWLDEHLPAAAGELSLCHGGYQPLCVSGPPAADWAAHGGPGKGLRVANWSRAVLAEPEFDVAFTLVAFWSAPFFAKNRAERTAIKMIRNTLLNTYRQGYGALRQVDADRLNFWRAFHALRGMARLDGAYDGTGSAFETQDRGPLPDELGPELARYFQQITRAR